MAKKVFAIANYRVSSDEQLKNNSLARQEQSVRKAAEVLGADIVRFWSGSVSSKKGRNLDRTDLEEMLAECKNNRSIKYAIFDELDRFMRSMLEIGYFIIQFQRLGVQIKFASQPDLKTDTAADTLLLMLEAYKAEGSNEERQRKSIAGQVTALQQGKYPFSPKPGYVRGSETGIQEIHPTRGPALQKVLIKIASHETTPTKGLVELNASEFTNGRAHYKMDKFRKILTDPFYAGIVEIDKQVKFRNENGLHQPLITKAQHIELLGIMNNRHKNQTGPRKNGNPTYPLNNITSCELCVDKTNGRYVGFTHSNGKNPNLRYEKYRCRACNRYIKREELHDAVKTVFKANPISEAGIDALVAALDIVWQEKEGQAAQEAARLTHRIQSLSDAITRQAVAAIDPQYAGVKEEILNDVSSKKEARAALEQELQDITRVAESDREEFIKFALNFAKNIGEGFFDESISQENRLRCKQIIFPAGFYVNNKNKVYTPEISRLITLQPKKKDTEVSQDSLLVRVQGL